MQQISANLRNPALATNENFTACLPAALFGVDLSRSIGLTLVLYGGMINTPATGNEYEQIPDVELELDPSEAALYVESDLEGNVTFNDTGWTPGHVRLYLAATSADGITSLVDYRVMLPQLSESGRPGIVALTQAEYDALSPPLSTTLYIASDTGNIYYGSMPLAGSST